MSGKLFRSYPKGVGDFPPHLASLPRPWMGFWSVSSFFSIPDKEFCVSKSCMCSFELSLLTSTWWDELLGKPFPDCSWKESTTILHSHFATVNSPRPAHHGQFGADNSLRTTHCRARSYTNIKDMVERENEKGGTE